MLTICTELNRANWQLALKGSRASFEYRLWIRWMKRPVAWKTDNPPSLPTRYPKKSIRIGVVITPTLERLRPSFNEFRFSCNKPHGMELGHIPNLGPCSLWIFANYKLLEQSLDNIFPQFTFLTTWIWIPMLWFFTSSLKFLSSVCGWVEDYYLYPKLLLELRGGTLLEEKKHWRTLFKERKLGI